MTFEKNRKILKHPLGNFFIGSAAGLTALDFCLNFRFFYCGRSEAVHYAQTSLRMWLSFLCEGNIVDLNLRPQ